MRDILSPSSWPAIGAISALVVANDDGFARLIVTELATHNAAIRQVPSPRAAFDAAAASAFDVVVLDMQPSWRGDDVLGGLRARCDAPIIVIAEGAEEAEQALNIEGADDCVVKPFSPRELLARIRAAVRRDREHPRLSLKRIQLGQLVIDEGTREVVAAGKPIALTTTEFDLLAALAKRPGCTLSREELLRLVRGRDEKAFDRLIDVQISRLRHKLSAHPECASAIRTVRGEGYRIGKLCSQTRAIPVRSARSLSQVLTEP